VNAGADAETSHATAQALQRKLVEYLRTVKKSDEQKDAEKSVTDQDARYFKCLAQVNELRDEMARLRSQYDKTAMEMKKRFEDKEKKAQEIKDAFIEFKRWKEVGMAIRARPMGTLREWLEHVAHVHPLDVDAAVAESANTSNC